MATPPLNKDVKKVIKEISKPPFGLRRASQPDKSRPMLTIAETLETKEAQTKTSPVTVKKKGANLTPAEKDKAIKQIAKERGISYNQAKETLRKELTVAPKATPVKQPTVILPKGIPFRPEIEDVAPRAVSYKGKTIYLTPGQIKAMGLVVDYPESTFVGGEVKPKTQYERITGISPLSREIKDVESVKAETRLRAEAAKDWSNQARAAALNPQVRNPADALAKGKVSPDSSKAVAFAEELANKLYDKEYKLLTSKERARVQKEITIITAEDNRNKQKVTRSVVGAQMDEQKVVRSEVKRYKYKGSTPPIVPKIPIPKIIGPLGYIGMAAEMFFSYKLMLQQDAERRQQEAMN
jgi:hypothetical protein